MRQDATERRALSTRELVLQLLPGGTSITEAATFEWQPPINDPSMDGGSGLPCGAQIGGDPKYDKR
jgi:hypothetical protein